jgi:4-amino-4-deoxy-L-arabinose transferase-like glycosyltransferase
VVRNGVVYDETTYLLAGSFLKSTYGLWVNRVHPPLMKWIYAIPVSHLAPQEVDVATRAWTKRIDDNSCPGCAAFDIEGIATTAIYQRNPLILWLARWIALGFGSGLLILIYFWSERLFGPLGGVLSVATAALTPDLIAHASVATLDLPLTFWMLLTASALDLYLRRGNMGWLFLSALGFTGSVLTKYTGFLSLGFGAALFLFHARSASASENGRRLIRIALMYTAVFLPITAAAYRFQEFGLPLKESWAMTRVLQHSPLRSLGWLRIPLPLPFIDGIVYLFDHYGRGYPSYFTGKYEMSGVPSYYPIALFSKLPVVIIAAFAIGTGTALLSKSRAVAITLLACMSLVILFFCWFHTLNLGIRYLLPLYPFVFILIGASARYLTGKRMLPKVAGVGLIVWLLVINLKQFPSYLSYFNETIRSEADFQRFGCDTNLDWGQDYPELVSYLREHHIKKVALYSDDLLFRFFIDPKIYGLNYEIWKPEIAHNYPLALGACYVTAIKAGWVPKDKELIELVRRAPAVSIHHSIYVFFPTDGSVVARRGSEITTGFSFNIAAAARLPNTNIPTQSAVGPR